VYGIDVGLTHVTVSISALARTRRRYEAEFLVDTGTKARRPIESPTCPRPRSP
jgi:hypothetical protein